MFNGKNVLVAGGTGMIGRYLVELLHQEGASIRVVAIDDESLAPAGVSYYKGDLTDKAVCLSACEDMDYVFNLAGIKGSPKKCFMLYQRSRTSIRIHRGASYKRKSIHSSNASCFNQIHIRNQIFSD